MAPSYYSLDEARAMTSRRLLVMTLAFAIASVPTVMIGQQMGGVIGGHASRQFAPHYEYYTVQLRDVATGRPVLAKPLDPDGQFSFPNLELNQRYLVELYENRQTAPVCTKGPFRLAPDAVTEKTDVTIECGKVPAILWLLAAGAGTAASVAISTVSPSR